MRLPPRRRESTPMHSCMLSDARRNRDSVCLFAIFESRPVGALPPIHSSTADKYPNVGIALSTGTELRAQIASRSVTIGLRVVEYPPQTNPGS